MRTKLKKSVSTLHKEVSKFENKSINIGQYNEHKEKGMKKNKQILRDLWDTIKHIKLCIMRPPGEKKEKYLSK